MNRTPADWLIYEIVILVDQQSSDEELIFSEGSRGFELNHEHVAHFYKNGFQGFRELQRQ